MWSLNNDLSHCENGTCRYMSKELFRQKEQQMQTLVRCCLVCLSISKEISRVSKQKRKYAANGKWVTWSFVKSWWGSLSEMGKSWLCLSRKVTVRNCEGSELLLYLQINKSSCHSTDWDSDHYYLKQNQELWRKHLMMVPWPKLSKARGWGPFVTQMGSRVHLKHRQLWAFIGLLYILFFPFLLF